MSPGRVNSSPQSPPPDLAALPDMAHGGTPDIGSEADLSVGDLAGSDAALAQFPDLSEAILPAVQRHSGCAMSDASPSGTSIAWVAAAAALFFLRRRRVQTTKA
jgi:MYXO-CTERM domain-containing protein